jgi:hypothetical protein
MGKGIIKQPDLSGVSEDVRKYIESLNDGYDEMIVQLEKATDVIEELTSETDAPAEGDDDDEDETETEETPPPAESKDKKKPVVEAKDGDDEEPPADKETKVGKSQDLTDILKAHPELAKAIGAANDRAERAEKIAKAERDRRLKSEFIAKAATLDALAIETEPVADVLQKMAEKLTPAENEVIWKTLHAANEQARSGSLFDELGSSARGGKTGAAETDLSKAAKALMDKDPALDYTSAVTKAVAENQSLYHEYIEEQRQVRR